MIRLKYNNIVIILDFDWYIFGTTQIHPWDPQTHRNSGTHTHIEAEDLQYSHFPAK